MSAAREGAPPCAESHAAPLDSHTRYHAHTHTHTRALFAAGAGASAGAGAGGAAAPAGLQVPTELRAAHKSLTDMGFDEKQALEALKKAKGNVEAAAEALLS